MDEVEEYGLRIMDEEKLHKRVLRISKKNMIFTFIFWGMIILIITKWVIQSG